MLHPSTTPKPDGDTAFCPGCGNQHQVEDAFCARCGKSLLDRARGANRTVGGHVIDGGVHVGASIESSFNVTTYTTDGTHLETEMRRTRQTALPLRAPGPVATAVAALTSMGLVLAGTLKPDPIAEYSLAVLLVGLALASWIVFWIALRQRRYVPVKVLNGGPPHGLELDDDGRVYFTTLAVTCPFCAGRMTLHTDDAKRPILVCVRAPKLHRLRFDHTQLPLLLPPSSPGQSVDCD